LARDFHDPKGLDGYWLTEFGKECLKRIASGFGPASGRRAWRLTGDFGSGKSSFALLLANVFRDAKHRLPKGLREHVLKTWPEAAKHNFIPVLVTGSREPIGLAILRALHTTLEELFPRGAKSSLEQAIIRAIKSGRVADESTLEMIQEANVKIIQSHKGDGILLILDEVGKFLEFAAHSPDRQDVFFLQQLAEIASRSGRHPLMLICLLHQGFSAYAEQLVTSSQREWEKVAGRFDEILFHQPLDQVASLVASALNPDVGRMTKSAPLAVPQAEASMEEAVRLGWYGTSASRETLRRLPARLFPLDPMLLPVLVRVFQRFGQNERSLFSFLCSHEPFGLRSFAQQHLLCDDSRHYQLADFYDYVRANFGHRLEAANYRSHWNIIESIVEAHPEHPLEIRILKTVGLLNLLNADDLRPTLEAVRWAVGGKSARDRRDVSDLLSKLVDQRRIYFRGQSRGYSLWPYSSVDIDSRLEEAKKAIPRVHRISEVIAEQLDARPVVARAHYIRTGNLRYFDVAYCKPEEMSNQARDYQTQADGLILVPLCETEAESKACREVAKNLNSRTDLILLCAVPRALSHLNQAALDALRWEWVQQNTPELNNDRMARDEVQLYLQEARNRLQSQVQQFVGLNRLSGESTLVWHHYGQLGATSPKVTLGRDALRLLSKLCDEAYSQSPKIKNELINRHNLSSAAAGARMRLLELMFAHADKPELGLPQDRKPPEKSMYLSVLRKTNLHQEVEGKWKLAVPGTAKEDTAHIRPVLNKIKALLAKNPDKRISVAGVMEELRRPPYGLRHGLFPIFLAIVAIHNEQEVAFYENGSFLREVGKEAFLRMTKSPEKFEIQLCKMEGVRSQLFQQLAQVLQVSRPDDKDVELLDVVRNLCQFVAQLPEYVRHTKRSGNKYALAVRDVILNAREPVRMVFHDLPEACGFAAFEVRKSTPPEKVLDFVRVLKEALGELRSAFPQLQGRMEKALATDFDYTGMIMKQFRRKLAERAEALLVEVTENKLKAFAFRLFDDGLSENEWLNSVGSVLALRPPEKWKDEDEDTFHRELAALSAHFKRAESAMFSQGRNGKTGRNLRVTITQADGKERQEVIHIEEDEEKLLRDLQEQIRAVIAGNGRLGLAAASRVIWSQLKSVEEKE